GFGSGCQGCQDCHSHSHPTGNLCIRSHQLVTRPGTPFIPRYRRWGRTGRVPTAPVPRPPCGGSVLCPIGNDVRCWSENWCGDLPPVGLAVIVGPLQHDRSAATCKGDRSPSPPPGYPAGIRMYVHRSCASAYLEQFPRDRAVFEPHTEQWSPADLISRFRDVTHCDHCRREFLPTDDGYIAYWVVSREELRLLEEVQREQSSQRPAEP